MKVRIGGRTKTNWWRARLDDSFHIDTTFEKLFIREHHEMDMSSESSKQTFWFPKNLLIIGWLDPH